MHRFAVMLLNNLYLISYVLFLFLKVAALCIVVVVSGGLLNHAHVGAH